MNSLSSSRKETKTMSENYIVINGKRAELTEEQLKALGIEVKEKSPFIRAIKNEVYYWINGGGYVESTKDTQSCVPEARYKAANYCTDKGTMEQRALHETLNRLLWRYSMEHEGDKIDWNDTDQEKFYIRIAYNLYDWDYVVGNEAIPGVVFFHTEEITEAAIKEIIKPFMEKHPDFVW